MKPIFKPKHDREAHNKDRDATANSPEIALRSVCIGNASEVHPEVRCEEGQGKKDDGHHGEDEDRFVVRLGDDGKFVLFDGAELEELDLDNC